MKNIEKIIPYKLRTLIPALGLAGLATASLTSCEKEPETRDVELFFHTGDYSTVLYQDRYGNREPSLMAKTYANDPTVGTIYLVPIGTWSTYVASTITNMRKVLLEPLFDYSPKFKGKGDFDFYPGAPSEIPEDSLWIVSKGFTINKYRPSTDYQR